jgi:hypothetical protein
MLGARGWTLPPPERADLQQEVDRWFIRHGVPQFTERYSTLDRLHFLVAPLVVLVAFEIGAAPWFMSPIMPLLVVPPAIVMLLFLSRLLASTVIESIRTRHVNWTLVGRL